MHNPIIQKPWSLSLNQSSFSINLCQWKDLRRIILQQIRNLNSCTFYKFSYQNRLYTIGPGIFHGYVLIRHYANARLPLFKQTQGFVFGLSWFATAAITYEWTPRRFLVIPRDRKSTVTSKLTKYILSKPHMCIPIFTIYWMEIEVPAFVRYLWIRIGWCIFV